MSLRTKSRTLRRRRAALARRAGIDPQDPIPQGQDLDTAATTSFQVWKGATEQGTLRGGSGHDGDSSENFQYLSSMESGIRSARVEGHPKADSVASRASDISTKVSQPPKAGVQPHVTGGQASTAPEGSGSGSGSDSGSQTGSPLGIMVCFPDAKLGITMARIEAGSLTSDDMSDKEIIKAIQVAYKKRQWYWHRKLRTIRVCRMVFNSNGSVAVANSCEHHSRLFSSGTDCCKLAADVQSGKYHLGPNRSESQECLGLVESCLCNSTTRLTSTYHGGGSEERLALSRTIPKFVGKWLDPAQADQIVFWGLLIEECQSWGVLGGLLAAAMVITIAICFVLVFTLKQDVANGLSICSLVFAGLALILAYFALPDEAM